MPGWMGTAGAQTGATGLESEDATPDLSPEWTAQGCAPGQPPFPDTQQSPRAPGPCRSRARRCLRGGALPLTGAVRRGIIEDRERGPLPCSGAASGTDGNPVQ